MIDERLSIWGWETGTGARFAIVADAWGRSGEAGGGKQNKGVGEGDVKGVCLFFLLIFLFCFFNSYRIPHRVVPTAPSATGHPQPAPEGRKISVFLN